MINSEIDLQSWWRRACPLYEHVGLVVESANDGVFRCKIPLTEKTSNHFQTMHAAMQMAVAEVLGGIVGISLISPDEMTKTFGAAKSFSIDFLRPARTSVTAETRLDMDEAKAIRTALSQGQNSEFTLHAEIVDDDGQIVAKSKAVYVLRPLRATAR